MILITGGNGQLGMEICHLLEDKNLKYDAPSSSVLDITKYEDVQNYINNLNPDFIFHCAAYTAVDKAESDASNSYIVNATGTENIAVAAKNVNAKVIYVSTDFVFDGTKIDGEYETTDETNPLNIYGKSKLEGEMAIQKYLDEFYIVRTSWVFGIYGNNFVKSMQKLAKDNKVLTVVDDQVGRPTSTKTLSEFILYLYETLPEPGIYHLSNDDTCSWYEFAKEILKNETEIDVQPISSEQYPQAAKRPGYSVMSLEKAKSIGFKIPSWKEALAEYLKN